MLLHDVNAVCLAHRFCRQVIFAECSAFLPQFIAARDSSAWTVTSSQSHLPHSALSLSERQMTQDCHCHTASLST